VLIKHYLCFKATWCFIEPLNASIYSLIYLHSEGVF